METANASNNNSTNAATATCAGTSTVQHVTKKSSDELLRKFAELGGGDEEEEEEELSFKRRKKGRKVRGKRTHEAAVCESPSSAHYYNGSGGSLVERRSLLPLPVTRKKSALLRQLGIGRSSRLRARDSRNKSVFATIGKTWRKTLEGASKVILEKHYNRHRRLINDVA